MSKENHSSKKLQKLIKMPLRLLIAIATCVLLTHAKPQDDTESFITKEAAKELRTKLSSSIEQQDDYDEILKDIIRGLGVKPKSGQQQIIYEKRYFDYLPNEIMDTDDVASEDLTHESVSSDSSSGFESPENNKRSKRDTSVREKRHYQIYHQPLRHYSPFPQVSFYIPYDLFSDPFPAFEPPSYNSWTQPNYNFNPQYNPGNPHLNPGRFHPPGNYYLPPSPTQPPRVNSGYLPPSRDQQANLPHPPDNEPNDVDNRVGGFEGPDPKVVVDYYPIRSIDNNQITGSASSGVGGNIKNKKYSYNRQPTQSTFNFDPNSLGKDSQELDIESAPEIQEEVSTTTRAPFQKPTRRNRNKSQQQNGRQNSESLTTTTTTERTNISQQDLAVAGNNGKPNKPLSACVEAIVNCCSRYDEIVRLPCFEAHHCNGAFFGRSPCSRALKQAAFKEVEKYSETKRR